MNYRCISVFFFILTVVDGVSALTLPPTASEPANALQFQGGAQKALVDDESAFDFAGAFTLEAWIKIDAFDSQWQAILTKGDAWGITRNKNSGSLAFRTKSGNKVDDLTGTVSVNDGNWHHVAAVYDGNEKHLYIDGQLDVAETWAKTLVINNIPLTLANNEEDTGVGFKGCVDAVRVWSDARSASEIGAHFGRNLQGDEPGLLALWRFSEGSGTSLADSSLNSHSAVLENTTDGNWVNGLALDAAPPIATISNGAVRFDGSAAQLARTKSEDETDFDLPAASSLTLEAWVNLAGDGLTEQSIVSKGGIWRLALSANERKLILATSDGNQTHVLEGDLSIAPNRWTHVAGVLDAAADEKRLYVDGVLEKQGSFNGALGFNDANVLVGGNEEMASSALAASVDMARVWQSARTQQELSEAMFQNLTGNESGLLMDWRFNEPSGSDVVDESAAQHHGELVGATDANRVLGLAIGPPPPPTAIVANGASSFNGTTRVIINQGATADPNNPSAATFDLNGPITIESWVNVAAFDQPWQPIVTKGNAWGITRYAETNKVAFRTGLGFGPLDLASSRELELNRWYHLAAVFDGQQKRLYIDGTLEASQPFTGPLLQNGSKISLGGNEEDASQGFNGRLDDTRIWAIARSEQEIAALVDHDLRGAETGLLADWRFNESSGTAVVDWSVNGFSGTASSALGQVNGLSFLAPIDGEYAMRFDANASQHIQLNGSSGLQANEGLTLETWVLFQKSPANNSEAALLSKGSGAWGLYLNSAGQVRFHTGGISDANLLSSALSPNTWHHVAATWNKALGRKVVYVDGSPVAEDTGLSGNLANSSHNVLMAAQPGGSVSQFYDGILDEVRIWSRERSASEINENSLRHLNGNEPGLYGAWQFSKGSGNTAVNETPNGSAGSLQGGMDSRNRVDGLLIAQAASPQYAISFNGTQTQSISISHSAALQFTGSLTIEAWVKPSGNGVRTIVMKGSNGYGLALGDIDADNQAPLLYTIDGTLTNALRSQLTVENGRWQHVAVVVDGIEGTTTFFVDGRADTPLSSAVISNNTSALSIGRRGGSNDRYYWGELDEVRLWGSARNELQVQFFAFRELDSLGGLNAYYPFNDGRGLTLTDVISGNNGTLTNLADADWIQGHEWGAAELPSGLNFAVNPNAAGLWIGNVLLNRVTEVQKAVGGQPASPSTTAEGMIMRILLHVDGQGNVRMLKDVIAMRTRESAPGANDSVGVLVTNPLRIPEFEGVLLKQGKRVGVRYGTAAYDFNGNELPILGGLGDGLACAGAITLDQEHPTNPYRHKYHPDHGVGFDIVREFQMHFQAGDSGDRLTGSYSEAITGLHKIPITMSGSIHLERISTTPLLNNEL